MTTPQATHLQYAIAYAGLGWKVFPAHQVKDGKCSCNHADCDSRAGKHPRTRNGVKDASCDIATITEWWHKWPEANIGVACGAASGFWVVDIDPAKGGDDSIALLEQQHGRLPPTVEALTGGGGRHLLFVPVDGISNRVNFRPGLDVRSDGGYIILAPSAHRSGQRYEWEADCSPSKISIAPAPQWLIDVVRSANSATVPGSPVSRPAPKSAPVVAFGDERKRRYLQSTLDSAVKAIVEAPEGTRNDELNKNAFSILQLVAGGELDQAMTWAALTDAARASGLKEAETQRTLGSAWKKASQKPRLVPAPDPSKSRHHAAPTTTPPEIKQATSGYLPSTVDLAAKPVPINGVLEFENGDHVELGHRLNDELRKRGEIVCDEIGVSRYEESTGIWRVIEESERSKVVQSFHLSEVSTDTKPLRLRASDISGACKLANDQIAKPGFFASAPRGVSFANGFLAVEGRSLILRPHSPANGVRFGYDFDYGNAPGCPIWADFLESVFRDDEDRDDKISLLAEFCGAALLGMATRYQRCVVLIGGGANGKSVFGNTIASCFPPGSVTAIPPQDWAQEYRRAMLPAILLNTVNELPEADILDSEAFKAIVDGSNIMARRIREAPFMFSPRAGHVFAVNNLPGTNDQSDGFWRRYIAITFNRTFSPDEQDNDLTEKLKSERAGIIEWMIDGARRLLEQGKLTVPASSGAALGEWRKQADTVSAFLEEETIRSKSDYDTTQASKLYEAFAEWCKRNGHKAPSSTKFGRRMRALGISPIKGGHGVNIYPVVHIGSGPR